MERPTPAVTKVVRHADASASVGGANTSVSVKAAIGSPTLGSTLSSKDRPMSALADVICSPTPNAGLSRTVSDDVVKRLSIRPSSSSSSSSSIAAASSLSLDLSSSFTLISYSTYADACSNSLPLGSGNNLFWYPLDIFVLCLVV